MKRKTRNKTQKKTATIIPFGQDVGREESAFARRWGSKLADHGYTMVPHLLLALQAEIALTSPQVVVLLHLMDHWWHSSESWPWPSLDTIANRMSKSPRQVQRIITELETEGLVKKVPRYYSSGGRKSNAYDLGGLVKRLKKLEPAYRVATEANRARRAEAETPARRRRAGSPPTAK